ncbi:dephospho-CoA kinase/protein folding accessory domain-containing protein [Streptococcus pneumoniae]|nr:dephospho-CoA kinase/protein folding accessory domain-containing protein [Streptococcus pneumoniae]
MFEKGNPEIVRHLAFRDYMMAHCEEAEAYATLKKELAEKYTYDGELYTEGKNEFVRNVDEKAKEWRKNNVNE